MRRALLVLLVALAWPAAARAADAEADVRAVFDDPRYRFCHEKDYPLTIDEHAWCEVIGDPDPRCPALPEACKKPPVDPADAASLRSGRGGPRSGGKDGDAWGRGPDARPSGPDQRKRPEPEPLTLPDLSGLAQIILIALILGFIVVVVRSLLKNFSEESAADKDPDAPPPDAAAKAAEAAPRGPVETDVERLLNRARAAAARGDHARAIDDAYAALLRRLDGDGLIDIHPSRTNGDYVRALSDRPDLKRAVRDVVRDVERVQFGSSPPSESIFRAVIDRVVPLVSRALALAILFIGLGSAASCADLGGEGGGDFHSDASPSGLAAIGDLLKKRGYSVRYRTEPLAAIEGKTTLVILPGARVDAEGWKRLMTWADAEDGRLVLAGVDPPPDLELRIASGGKGSGAHVGRSFQFTYPAEAMAIAIPPGTVIVDATDPERDVSGALLERDNGVYAIERRFTGGRVVAFADERLFTNAALAAGGNAAFLTAFFDSMPAPRTIEFIDRWTGVGARTPIDSVREAHLTPLILQIFALLFLLYMWRGRAFARLRDPPAEARRAFADHARALGQAYRRARASRHVLGIYAVWAMERLRERVHRSGRRGLVPLAEAIAARTGRSEAEVMRVLVDAGSARDEAAPPSSFRPHLTAQSAKPRREEAEADLALMRDLGEFLTATGAKRPARRSRKQKA